jgi:hypothetical protein
MPQTFSSLPAAPQLGWETTLPTPKGVEIASPELDTTPSKEFVGRIQER